MHFVYETEKNVIH